MNGLIKSAMIIGIAVTAALFASAAQAIEVNRFTTPSGIDVWHVEDRTIPTIAMRFSFHGGANEDPKAMMGLTQMATHALNADLERRSSNPGQTNMADLGAGLRFEAGRNYIYGSFHSLAAFSDEAFAMLGAIIGQPHLEGHHMKYSRQHNLLMRNRTMTTPRGVAQTKLMAKLFPTSPMGRQIYGTELSLNEIKLPNVQQWIATRFTKARLRIVVVGAINQQQLAPLIDDVFGALPQGSAFMPPPAQFATKADTTIIGKGDIPQAIIMNAVPGIALDDPDYMAARVLIHILGGGGLTSRLIKTIREDHGLAYSAHAGLYNYDEASFVLIETATRQDAYEQTLSLLADEKAKLAKGGVTADEVEDAKSYLIGAYPLGFDGNSAIADRLLGIRNLGFGPDYIHTRALRIEKVSTADVNRVAKRLFGTRQGHTLVVR